MRTMFFTKGKSSVEDFRYWLDSIGVADKPDLSSMIAEFLRLNPTGVDVWATGDRGHIQWMLRWLPTLPQGHVDWVAWSERSSRITSCMLTRGSLKLLDGASP